MDREVEMLTVALHRGRAYNRTYDDQLPPVSNDDILDIMAYARRIRQLNAQLTLVIEGKLPIDIIDGVPMVIETEME